MGKYYPDSLQSDAYKHPLENLNLAKYAWAATETVAADDDGVLVATATKTTAQVITTMTKQPPCARNVTVKSGGSAGDLKASKITVRGTNIAGAEIYEEFDVTVDTALDATGTKAFKSVTAVEIPAQDGTTATIQVGWGVKYGLPIKLEGQTPMWGYIDGKLEATAPTLVADADELEKNVVSFNTAPNGKATVFIFAI